MVPSHFFLPDKNFDPSCHPLRILALTSSEVEDAEEEANEAEETLPLGLPFGQALDSNSEIIPTTVSSYCGATSRISSLRQRNPGSMVSPMSCDGMMQRLMAEYDSNNANAISVFLSPIPSQGVRVDNERLLFSAAKAAKRGNRKSSLTGASTLGLMAAKVFST